MLRKNKKHSLEYGMLKDTIMSDIGWAKEMRVNVRWVERFCQSAKTPLRTDDLFPGQTNAKEYDKEVSA